MLIRIVRMTFQLEKVPLFLEIFEESKNKIRATNGCIFLELWQDLENPCVFMTHSHWSSAEDLENYRHSEFFKATWAKTKLLFEEKPLAFSSAIISHTKESS